ncbi:MAG: lipoyl(octanoyl) transferase LipB [Proteobacteria bacterium]|nr:lipoyl(octanoyl) transferase LipB [Pseudomonadota bacterium]
MQEVGLPTIEVWDGLTPYEEAVRRMEAAVAAGQEKIIFCEHEQVFTVGSSGDAADVREAAGVPVVASGRGGKVTWHGPGQRVVYLVVNLDRFGRDVRAYVRWLQGWLVAALGTLSINAYTTDDIGVWVDRNEERGTRNEAKIAAVGIRVRRGVAYHGISLNVNNDLSVYQRFVACGLEGKDVTRVADVLPLQNAAKSGETLLMAAVDEALRGNLLRNWPH